MFASSKSISVFTTVLKSYVLDTAYPMRSTYFVYAKYGGLEQDLAHSNRQLPYVHIPNYCVTNCACMLAYKLAMSLLIHKSCAMLYNSFCLADFNNFSNTVIGQKWNPLRARVDSIPYDTSQLAFGTIIFTVLLFLLPTTGIYYLVFTLLRLPVIILKTVAHCLVQILTTIPVHDILERIFLSTGRKGKWPIMFQ